MTDPIPSPRVVPPPAPPPEPPPAPPGGFRMTHRRIGLELAIGALLILGVVLFFATSSAWMARWALSLVPPSIDQKIGAAAAFKIRATTSACTNPRAVAYVESLVTPLIEATDHPIESFQFTVLDDPSINAFALPGGYIFVHSGLLEAASSGEEIAGVLAHELSHVVLRHGVEGVLRDAGRRVLIGIVLGYGDAGALVEYGGSLRELAYGRAQETDADEMGHGILRHAGISPSGMATFFQRLAREGVSIPAILSTHPDSTERADQALRAADDFTPSTSLAAPTGITCHGG